MAEQASFEQFASCDIRVVRVTSAEPLEGARRPAYRLTLDCGDEIGTKQSSAQITERYTPDELVGRLVLAIVNFPPKRVAGFKSEVLVLGIYSAGGSGPVVLVTPDENGKAGVVPGDRLG